LNNRGSIFWIIDFLEINKLGPIFFKLSAAGVLTVLGKNDFIQEVPEEYLEGPGQAAVGHQF
jgi:hypothetical protein